MRGVHIPPPKKNSLEYFGLWLTGLLMCFASLTGCSTKQEPIIKIENQIVKVPVAVGCIEESKIPERISENYPFKKSEDIGTKTQQLLIERNNRIILEEKLFAIIKGCKLDSSKQQP